MWPREDMVGTVDVLFVDEAGQTSLANVLGSAPASGAGSCSQISRP
jgi:hypothetical protein